MTESTKRALRTLIQVAMALGTTVPVLYAAIQWATETMGADSKIVSAMVAVLAGVTAVSKIMGTLEERGYIRPTLRYLGDDRDA